jgi:hypothetical protein
MHKLCCTNQQEIYRNKINYFRKTSDNTCIPGFVEGFNENKSDDGNESLNFKYTEESYYDQNYPQIHKIFAWLKFKIFRFEIKPKIFIRLLEIENCKYFLLLN